MSYMKKFAKWNSTSFQVQIYPYSTTKEELGKIFISDDNKYEWYVNPCVTCPDEWLVNITTWGKEETFKKAKEKIESFIKKT